MERLNELALFAGAGGGLLGSILNGWRTVCAVEINDYCRRVLLQRQADGCLEPFPIWDDVTTFDGRPWRGCVDIVTGGFPCQDISAAGKGAGIEGERSGLWSEFARIIGEVRPRFAFVENSPMLTVRGLGRVLGDLAAMGFDAQWGCISAASQGAPHIRDRILILADAGHWIDPEWSRSSRRQGGQRASVRQEPGVVCANVPHPARILEGRTIERPEWERIGASSKPELTDPDGQSTLGIAEPRSQCTAWLTEPDVGRVAHGVDSRVDRLKAIGNGQVPAVVRAAWELLIPQER